MSTVFSCDQKTDGTNEIATCPSTVNSLSIDDATIQGVENWIISQSSDSTCPSHGWLKGLAAVTMAFSPGVAEGSNTFPIEHAETIVQSLHAPCVDEGEDEFEAEIFDEEFPVYDDERWNSIQEVRDYLEDVDY